MRLPSPSAYLDHVHVVGAVTNRQRKAVLAKAHQLHNLGLLAGRHATAHHGAAFARHIQQVLTRLVQRDCERGAVNDEHGRAAIERPRVLLWGPPSRVRDRLAIEEALRQCAQQGPAPFGVLAALAWLLQRLAQRHLAAVDSVWKQSEVRRHERVAHRFGIVPRHDNPPIAITEQAAREACSVITFARARRLPRRHRTSSVSHVCNLPAQGRPHARVGGPPYQC